MRSNVFCRSDVEGFESEFGVPYTKLNCDFFNGTNTIYNCSHASYYGIDVGELAILTDECVLVCAKIKRERVCVRV